jgi:LuxR family maltose regulon positive regulatory protein
LLERVSRGVQRTPVTLISGRIGTGKTVLAGCWARAQQPDVPRLWLTLRAGDGHPENFGDLVTASLERAGVVLPAPNGLGGPEPTGPLRQFGAWLRARSRPVVVIVDNAEDLTDRWTTDALDLLIRETAGGVRLVLCADADPLLPLAAYRRTGALTEIRDDEMRFTADETGALLELLGAPVTADQSARLARATEGWPVALRMAAACLQAGGDPDELAADLAADDGNPVQYLLGRVLDDQPPELRRFLLRESVTSALSPEVDPSDSADRRWPPAGLFGSVIERAPPAPGGVQIHPLIRRMLLGHASSEPIP